MENIYKILADLNISYEKYEHQAVFTCEEAGKYDMDIDAGKCKNLFLRNIKGDNHYLVVVEVNKRVDLKKLSETLKEDRLSFASDERLIKYLGLTSGAVSPFGLINDIGHEVNVIIDSEILKNDKLSFHPNINTASLVISVDDFKIFLNWSGNNYKFIII